MATIKKSLKKAQDGYVTKTSKYTNKTGAGKGVTQSRTTSTGQRPTGGNEVKIKTSYEKGNKYLGKNIYHKFENPKAAVNDTLSSQRSRVITAPDYVKTGGEPKFSDRHKYSIKKPNGVETVTSETPFGGGKAKVTRTLTKSKNGNIMKKKMKNGGSLTGLKASTRRDKGIDPKGSWTKVQEKTLAGAKGKAKLTADKQLGATKMAKRGMSIKKK